MIVKTDTRDAIIKKFFFFLDTCVLLLVSFFLLANTNHIPQMIVSSFQNRLFCFFIGGEVCKTHVVRLVAFVCGQYVSDLFYLFLLFCLNISFCPSVNTT